MNRFENWFCGSSLWRFVTERRLLPWILSGYALGDHVLEVGAGPGATTGELQRRAGRVPSLEYDPSCVAKLAEGRCGSLAVSRPYFFFCRCRAGVASSEITGAAECGFSRISSGVAAGRNVFRI